MKKPSYQDLGIPHYSLAMLSKVQKENNSDWEQQGTLAALRIAKQAARHQARRVRLLLQTINK